MIYVTFDNFIGNHWKVIIIWEDQFLQCIIVENWTKMGVQKLTLLYFSASGFPSFGLSRIDPSIS